MIIEIIEGYKCFVTGPQDILSFILDYTSPFFKEAFGRNFDLEIVIYETTNDKYLSHYSNQYTEIIDIHYDQRGFLNNNQLTYEFLNHQILFYSNKIEIHLNKYDKNRKYIPMRIIREIYYNILLNNGFKEFHAAGISLSGEGTLVLGHRNAGKTTTLLRFLKTKRAKFLSNDKVFVRIEDHQMYGYPTSINIRNTSWSILNMDFSIPTNHYQHFSWSEANDTKTYSMNALLNILKADSIKKIALSKIILLRNKDNIFEETFSSDLSFLEEFRREHPFESYHKLFSPYTKILKLESNNDRERSFHIIETNKFLDVSKI